jgi:serine/threonine protein kinase
MRNDRHVPRTLVSASFSAFSGSHNGTARSLNDIFKLVQPLGLSVFDDYTLRARETVGEGASYEVLRGNVRGQKDLVAVKRVKMQHNASERGALERQVECVLKDIEVMRHDPLAQHENILSLLGYGWTWSNKDIIPYIVTEYAGLGTLRQYLRDNHISIRARLALCSQVACGLQRLHWAGVAHGDIKMENVLVFPSTAARSTYETDVIVKIVSFPASLIVHQPIRLTRVSTNVFCS